MQASQQAAKRTYTVTVGEVGNDIGHVSTHHCATDEGAVRTAKREVAPYGGDGWWTVETEDGWQVAHGGRRQF